MSYTEEIAKDFAYASAGAQLMASKGENMPKPLDLLKLQRDRHIEEGKRLDTLIAFVEKNPEMVEQMQALRRYL